MMWPAKSVPSSAPGALRLKSDDRRPAGNEPNARGVGTTEGDADDAPGGPGERRREAAVAFGDAIDHAQDLRPARHGVDVDVGDARDAGLVRERVDGEDLYEVVRIHARLVADVDLQPPKQITPQKASPM